MGAWIFAYASLIWRPGFAYEERVVGFIKGYKRALHLACTDHRGTPCLPARVATLEPDPDSLCWGVAYSFPSPAAAHIALASLQARESEYDTLLTLDVYTQDGIIPHVHMFSSSSHNKHYLGAASLESMASQIAMAHGPCGSNREYLFRLIDALQEIGHEDGELLALAQAVRKKRMMFDLEDITAFIWPSASLLNPIADEDALVLMESAKVC